jgi:hypothetical protein
MGASCSPPVVLYEVMPERPEALLKLPAQWNGFRSIGSRRPRSN